MPQPDFPAADDLQSYLIGLGIINPAVYEAAFASMRLDVKAGAAKEAWEKRTGWYPYLSTGNATEERRFDPPGPNRFGWTRGGGRVLQLRCGILRLTSLKTGVTETSVGQTLTEGRDFWLTDNLDNHDYAARQQPASRIHFATTQMGAIRSIVIEAEYGFCAELPDLVFEMVRQYGAYLALAELRLNISRGLFSWRDLNAEIRYAGGGTVPLQQEEMRWKQEFLSQALRYECPGY